MQSSLLRRKQLRQGMEATVIRAAVQDLVQDPLLAPALVAMIRNPGKAEAAVLEEAEATVSANLHPAVNFAQNLQARLILIANQDGSFLQNPNENCILIKNHREI